MEAIPGSLLQKEPRHFKALRPALRTLRWVGFRCLATQAAASTPLPGRGRSFSTLQTTIRRLAPQRFYLAPPASTTPLLELLLFYTIPLPRTTQPLERSRSLATQKAAPTP